MSRLPSALNNCQLSGNRASLGGGAVLFSEGTLNNCTVSSNFATSIGGGAVSAVYPLNPQGGGMVNNTILWGNLCTGEDANAFGIPAGLGTDLFFDGAGINRFVCASDGVSHGDNGCITNNPQFVSADDFRLQVSSLCINAGDNACAPAGTDLAGHSRVVSGSVDMGALEAFDDGADGDADGLSDWVEVRDYFTDPDSSDTDGDLLPDAWETDAGLDALDASDAADDADGDGASMLAEYIADTDPYDRAECFRISGIDGKTVYFNSSDARYYTLYECTNLAKGVWVSVAHGRMGEGGSDSLVGTNSGSAVFYKVDVSLPVR